MMSSNGTGMGHLTRLLAYARHLPVALPGAEVSFLSLSTAVPVVRSLGHDAEYLPSVGATGQRPSDWRRFFTQRLQDVLERVGPDVVVFDGTHPYRGIDRAVRAFPQTRWVWSRRGMWRPGVSGQELQKAAWFDATLEPGDLSGAADRGATATVPDGEVHRVGPVTLVDREDLLDLVAARRHLGLPDEGPVALVSLGAGTLHDDSAARETVIAALQERDITVCLTQPAIGPAGSPRPDVHVVTEFPIARCLRAFDLAVVAGGYNSVHESLRLGVPTVLVPNGHTRLDDQRRRTAHAARQGWAVDLPVVTREATRAALEQVMADGHQMVARAASADPGNGAAAAAQLITALGAGRG